jgi:hypothetical protein
MRKSLLIICLVYFFTPFTIAQRNLEVIMESFPYTSDVRTISDDGKVLVAVVGGEFVVSYNDIAAVRYNYPTVGGVRYRFHDYSLVEYQNSVYFILSGAFGGRPVVNLFSYNEGVFSRIPIPGNIVSPAVTFGNDLYVLSSDGGIVKLFRYNGTSVTAVPSAFLPGGGPHYDLKATAYHVYMFSGNFSIFPSILRRYDGRSTFTFPTFRFPSGIKKILPVGTAGKVYFLHGYSLVYFDGISFLPVFDAPSLSFTDAVIWRDNLYFLNTIATAPAPESIQRAEGNAVLPIALPDGANVFLYSNLLVYRDNLFVQTTDGMGNSSILRYDGASYSNFFSIPGIVNAHWNLFLREGNLMMVPDFFFDRGQSAFEFDGISFATIEAPAGHYLFYYLDDSRCNHVWLTHNDDATLPPAGRIALSKEAKPGVSCIIASMPVPERIYEFERFGSVFGALGERECWSDIILDWVIEPICPVPEICPPSAFSVTLSDAQNNIAWEHKFEKPGLASIPLDGKLSFKTTLSLVRQNKEDLFAIDEDLISKGITGLRIAINPKNENFLLAARTQDGMVVPLRITLINKNGKEIWRKELKAPFITNIKDKVAEPGVTLRFSVPSPQEPLTVAKASQVELNFRNPSHGSLFVDITSEDKNLQGEIVVSNTLGQVISRQSLTSSRNLKVNLPEYRPGIFIISMRSNSGITAKRMVWLK